MGSFFFEGNCCACSLCRARVPLFRYIFCNLRTRYNFKEGCRFTGAQRTERRLSWLGIQGRINDSKTRNFAVRYWWLKIQQNRKSARKRILKSKK